MQQLRPEDIETMVMDRYPVIDEESWCATSRYFRNKARESYREKLANQYKEQLKNESAAATTIQRDQHPEA